MNKGRRGNIYHSGQIYWKSLPFEKEKTRAWDAKEKKKVAR